MNANDLFNMVALRVQPKKTHAKQMNKNNCMHRMQETWRCEKTQLNIRQTDKANKKTT